MRLPGADTGGVFRSGLQGNQVPRSATPETRVTPAPGFGAEPVQELLGVVRIEQLKQIFHALNYSASPPAYKWLANLWRKPHVSSTKAFSLSQDLAARSRLAAGSRF